jgi:predicted dienelactone hydrolase
VRARRILGGFAVLMLFGAAVGAALAFTLRAERKMLIILPSPVGQFAVGRTLYDWRDESAGDKLAPFPGTKRELLVWIWYPASPPHSSVAGNYLPADLLAPIQVARSAMSSKLLTRDLARVRAYIVDDAPASPLRKSYPVVLLRAGSSAEVWNYTALAADLASDGYVVVGIDAPWRSNVVVFPDGRLMERFPPNDPEFAFGRPDSAERTNALITAWTRDMSFVLDRLARLNAADSSGMFTGRLDLAHVGVVGHGLGGVEAAQFCHDDSRCQAGIDIDGAPLGSVMRDGVRQPFMFLLSGHASSADSQSRTIMAEIRIIYDRLPSRDRLLVELRGASHFLFSDDGALLKSHLALGALRRLHIVGMDGPRQLAMTSYCVRRFFATYLSDTATVRPPQLATTTYPEIRVLASEPAR